MTVRVYRSSDSSAPVMSGTAGALIGVLDACLVNGYGAKAAAGWAKSFAGTNLAAYRPPMGTRFYFRVDDTDAQNARVVGYESMSAISTGLRAFPTASMIAGGLYWLKSSAASATARDWLLLADEKRFFLFMNTSGVAAGAAWVTGLQMFGDFSSYQSSSAWNCKITGGTSTSISNTNNRSAEVLNASGMNQFAGITHGQYVPRAHNGVPIPIVAPWQAATYAIGSGGNGGVFGATSVDWANNPISNDLTLTYPDPSSGACVLARVYVAPNYATAYSVYGFMPGIWAPCIGGSVSVPNNGDTFDGIGDLAGRSFEFLKFSNGLVSMMLVLETSNTWS